MYKKINILTLLLLLSSIGFAQFVGKDAFSKAMFYLQKNELDSAKKYIDEASEKPELITPKFWYYKGFIYKELYKKNEKTNRVSPSRLTAIESLTKLMEVDSTEEFTVSAGKMINYLASTLYNDAARSLTPSGYELAIENYGRFAEAMKTVNPEANLAKQDIQFKLALASMLNKDAQNNNTLDSTKIYELKGIYEEVLALDSNNGSAQYNIGILYYNEAVNIINNMDYDMDLEELNRLQDVCIDLFLKALPYMQKSYDLGWNKRETLIGLGNIYHGLNDSEKEEFYKKELAQLQSAKRIQDLQEILKNMEENGEQDSEDYKNYKEELEMLQNKGGK